jgi:tRNA threonylcarbamoyl adenosine modification protein YeaZ
LLLGDPGFRRGDVKITRTLVIDTATAACSVALIEEGRVVASIHEVVGRGHAERLVPMIAELPDGGRAEHILVDVGPGSFTGIRVGIAAARGLAFGWGATLSGYTSTALVAAAGFAADPGRTTLAVVLEGGHGEVFMARYAASPFAAIDALVSLKPEIALGALNGGAIGNGVRFLTALDPEIDAVETLPRAADAILLLPAFATLLPRPIYGRAPDAKLPTP